MGKMQDSMSKMREPAEKKSEGEQEGKSPMEIHDHGDGTFHTIKDGKQEEHPDLLHMTTHVAHEHEPESDHFHAKHDGFEHESHGVHASGEHEETKQHPDAAELGENLKQFFGEEAQEPKETGSEESAPLGGM
jgi:hypothetical protein